MIPTRSTQQSSPASPCCCNSRPDGDNQFPEAQKPTRLLGRTSLTNQESSKGHKRSASGVNQPCKATSQSLLRSDISKDKEQRCRAQPGNPARWLQAGAKSLYKFAPWAKRLTYPTYPVLHTSANREGKATAKPNKSSIVSHSEEVHGFFVVGHQLGLMG